MRKSAFNAPKNTLTVVRVIVVAGALFLPVARAATAYWQTTNGGTFNSPGNWDTGLPGPLDTVIFASNATYQVNWAASATNQSAYFSNGTVTCAIGNATWFLNKELVVGRGAGANGWLYHTNGTLIVTNTLGSGKISSGQGANHNYTMIGGNAIVDQLDFVDDGSAAYSKFLHFGTLTTLHGSSLSVGSDLVFFYSGGQTGIWNMLGGTNVVYTPTSVDLYTQLGWAYDSKYIINVSGPSTVWSNNLNLYVGNTGSGSQVNLTNGARLESWSGLIGYWGLGNSVFVGSNSVWNNKGFLTVSVNGNGNRLTVTDGGRVNNTQGQIGSGGSGTSNTVLVTGANTLWNNTTNLFIGGEGVTNQLTIADGGRVNCYGCYLGGALSTFSPGAQMGNSLWVTGSNSLLQASSLVRAGQFGGFSLLVITNGGTVNGNTGSVGGSSGSTNNTVILTGPGSSWHSASTLTLGSTGGKNSIRVANGAQLINTRGIIGNGSSNNLVVVTGAGTLWSNATDLWVGGQIMSPHDNLLLVSDNATVLTTNLLISQSASAMSNYVTVSGGNLFVTNSSQYGTLDIRRGTLTLLAGLVETDQLLCTNTSASIFNFKSGQFNSRNSTVNTPQPLTVGSGSDWARLNLIGGAHSFANGLVISSNAWLTGNGAISGSATSAGVITPGDSFGILNFNNDLQLTVASDLAFKIGGYSAGFDLDFVSVTGNFTRNGTLHVALANGFVPGPSDTFYLVQSGAASGAFANVPSGSRLKTTDNLGSFVVTYDSFSLQLSNYQSTDLDGDGIEDDWATRFFGVSPLPNGTGPNDKFGDKDGDGLSNYAEFIAGTNPTNAASAFKLTPAGADAASIALRFPSVFGRTYHFWFSTNLADWVELPVPGFTHPQPDFAQWTDDGSVLGSVPFTTRAPRYYRLAVE